MRTQSDSRLVSALHAASRAAAYSLAPPPAALGASRQTLIRGITGEMVAVVDVEALGGDTQVAIIEERRR